MERWLNARITIPIPEEEYDLIKKHPEIRWGAVARKAVLAYAHELEKMKETFTIDFRTNDYRKIQ
jgi:hypothetical protein